MKFLLLWLTLLYDLCPVGMLGWLLRDCCVCVVCWLGCWLLGLRVWAWFGCLDLFSGLLFAL